MEEGVLKNIDLGIRDNFNDNTALNIENDGRSSAYLTSSFRIIRVKKNMTVEWIISSNMNSHMHISTSDQSQMNLNLF